MQFELIEVSTWSRREYFEHYLNTIPCTYSMTLNVEITALQREIKAKGIKLYPVMIYLISAIVNRHQEFRTSIDPHEQVGVFDYLSPAYSVFQKESETFTNLWTEYSDDFSQFYERYLSDVQTYGEKKQFYAKPHAPVNLFTISSIPWVSFTGFNLNLPKIGKYLLPIFTTGKYFEQLGKMYLPISIQVHHAVCDGYHVARFVNELQEAIQQFKVG